LSSPSNCPTLTRHLSSLKGAGESRLSGRRDQEASFFTVIVWRDQAEHATESLTKGSRVVVLGRLQQRTWTAEDGSARSTVEVVADELGPSLRWATATTTKATRSWCRSRQRLPLWRLPLADPSTVEALTSRILGE